MILQYSYTIVLRTARPVHKRRLHLEKQFLGPNKIMECIPKPTLQFITVVVGDHRLICGDHNSREMAKVILIAATNK